jgi:predicted ATP-dependent endonuclease of OLD family
VIVHGLSLANFRGFEQIELAFEPDVNVIAGVNGVGKSGILQALTMLFSRALPEFTPSTARPISFTDDDIQVSKPALEASAIFTVADQQCHMGTQRVRGDDEVGDLWNGFWQRHEAAETSIRTTSFSEALRTRTLTGDLEATRVETERMLRALKERPRQPLVIYFSPRRQRPGRPRSLPEAAPWTTATWSCASSCTGFACRKCWRAKGAPDPNGR